MVIIGRLVVPNKRYQRKDPIFSPTERDILPIWFEGPDGVVVILLKNWHTLLFPKPFARYVEYKCEYYLKKCSIPRCVEDGINLPHSYVQILGLHEFHDMKLKFNREYINTNWGMHTVVFVGIEVMLMVYIYIHEIM